MHILQWLEEDEKQLEQDRTIFRKILDQSIANVHETIEVLKLAAAIEKHRYYCNCQYRTGQCFFQTDMFRKHVTIFSLKFIFKTTYFDAI